MAIYKLTSNKKKQRNRNIKKTVGFSLIIAASIIFLFMTPIINPIQTFLLGLFGVFGYPLCITLFVVGLALVNNRRYVMSLKYTICLILTVFFALCIMQLAIVGGNKEGLSFGDYLAKNYLDKWTAGGILIGFFSTIFLFLTTVYGAYIIFSIGFILCLALLLDSLNFLKREKKAKEPVSLQIKDLKSSITIVEKNEEVENVKQPIAEQTNVVLNGNLKEEKEKEEQKPLTARQLHGLDKKRNSVYEEKPVQVQQKKAQEQMPKSLKELILTPPQFDIDEYFKDVR